MEDEHKLKVQVSAIAVGLAVMAYQFFFNWGDDFDFIRLFYALVLGAVVGAATFGAMTVLGNKK